MRDDFRACSLATSGRTLEHDTLRSIGLVFHSRQCRDLVVNICVGEGEQHGILNAPLHAFIASKVVPVKFVLTLVRHKD